MNEDAREGDEEWISADVDIYSAYIETTNTKSTEAETHQGCSFVTATTSQNQVSTIVPNLQLLTETLKPTLFFTLHNLPIHKLCPVVLVLPLWRSLNQS